MLKIARGLFWLLVGLLVLFTFVVANAVMTVVDGLWAWVALMINRKFDAQFGDW
ncbi:hypothetical protein [Methylobacter tundripaludum]|uniref:hypothetical protein n=1 Tax=Methylobacter tundripaludum TaxID=173365 RepID=UPI0002E9FEA0|nr:hypothetical protein [Methylobacter tundripaludum]